jgi:parallel beta-helix repeat protein
MSIGFTALMLLSVLVVIDVFPIANVRGEMNAPHDDGLTMDAVASDNIWTTDGDWEVNFFNFVSHADKTILVNGNLIVEDGATLTLTGVTLQINGSYNGEFGISVLAATGAWDGGILTIEESLSGPSVITSYTEDDNHRFGFVVEGSATASREAHLYMTNSELRQCGWDNEPLNNSQDSGLWIGSSNNIIDGNDISDSFNGVNYIGLTASTNTFQNNNVSYISGNGTYVRTATDITVDNNQYFECGQAIDFNGSADAIVTNNYLNVIYRYGAYFGSTAGVTFNYNTVENLIGFLGWVFAAVVFSDFSSDITANYNTLHSLPYSGLVAFFYSGGVTMTYNKFDDLSRNTAFGASFGDTAYFYKNSAGENSTFAGWETNGFWINQITGLTEVIENSASNTYQFTYANLGAGIHLWSCDEAVVRGNVLTDNDQSGMYILDSGNVSLIVEDNVLESNGVYGIMMSEPDPANPQFGGVKNAIVDNNYVNDTIFGIVSDKGFNQKYTNNSLDGNTDTAVWTGVDGTYIAFNTITNSGDGTAAGQGGVGIVGGAYDPIGDPIVENVIFDQNTVNDNIAISTDPINGIYLSNADNIWINECNLGNNDVGINGLGEVSNVLVEYAFR